MTTYTTISRTCARCGTTSEQTELRSSTQFGTVDLDLRPPDMLRSTMHAWITECPTCRMCAPNIEDVAEAERAVVGTPDYLAARDEAGVPDTARKFHAHALMAAGSGAWPRAFHQLLAAAWVMDDAGNADLARRFRTYAIHCRRQQPDPDPSDRIQLLDVLRRAGVWDEAEALGRALEGEALDGPLPQIVAFENRLIAARDTGCYTIGDVREPRS